MDYLNKATRRWRAYALKSDLPEAVQLIFLGQIDDKGAGSRMIREFEIFTAVSRSVAPLEIFPHGSTCEPSANFIEC